MFGSPWTAGLFLVSLIKLQIYQSCPFFNVIFAARIESESLGRFLVQSVCGRGREGTVEIIANVSISRSVKPEKAHWSL